jgi:hypothetical protein
MKVRLTPANDALVVDLTGAEEPEARKISGEALYSALALVPMGWRAATARMSAMVVHSAVFERLDAALLVDHIPQAGAAVLGASVVINDFCTVPAPGVYVTYLVWPNTGTIVFLKTNG